MVDKAKQPIQLWHAGLMFMIASFVAGVLASMMESWEAQYGAAIVSLACLLTGVVLVVVGLFLRR